MPQLPRLVEGAAEQVVKLLQERLNTKLRMVYEDRGDKTINLEFVPNSRYYISDAIEPLQPPAVFVVPDDSDHRQAAQNFLGQWHTMLIGIVAEDIEIQRLQRKVWRYGAALALSLKDATGSGPYPIKCLVRGLSYGPTFVRGAAGQRQYRKDVTVRAEVIHFEPLDVPVG